MKHPSSNRKRLVWIATGAVALGAGFGIANVASAASSDSSTSVVAPAASNATPPADQAGRPDPASMPNGPGEQLLTGSDLSGVTAAVKSIDPTGTIIRAETDTDGHTFEAHVKQADGTVKTYYFTSTFQADGSTDGFRPGGAGGPHGGMHGDRQGPPPAGQAPQGQAPQGSAPAGSSTPTTAA